MSLVSIFASAILPIVAIAGVGFVLGRVQDVDAGPLNTVTVYVLAPALVFHSLATTGLSGRTLASVVVAVVAFHLVMIVVAQGVGRLVGESDPLLSALVLVSAFPNSGNYGVPVSEFAFGQTGRSTAVLYLSTQGVLLYTLGVYIATRGGGDTGLDGLKRVFTVPLVYAVVGALAIRWAGVVPPGDSTTMQTLELVGESSIPVMLLILGIQLARTDYGAALTRVGVPTALKMLVAPVVATGVAFAVGFQELTVARVFVLESAMPVAITPLILLMEFSDVEVEGMSVPEYVSTAVFVTTLVSVPLLTVLIFILQSGLVF